MNYPPLDIRYISIIDAFPIYNYDQIVLNVGCGEGRIDFYLIELGYKVYAADYNKHRIFKVLSHLDLQNIPFKQSIILDY